MNKDFICNSKQATWGGKVITCGLEHQCDECCRRERDALAAYCADLKHAAMTGGANAKLRQVIDKGPMVSTASCQVYGIEKAMEQIDMQNFQMAGKVDPVVLRYMGELGAYAKRLLKQSKGEGDE